MKALKEIDFLRRKFNNTICDEKHIIDCVESLAVYLEAKRKFNLSVNYIQELRIHKYNKWITDSDFQSVHKRTQIHRTILQNDMVIKKKVYFKLLNKFKVTK